MEYIIGSYEDDEEEKDKLNEAFVNEIDTEINLNSNASESNIKVQPMDSNRYEGVWEAPPVAASADVISNNATHRYLNIEMQLEVTFHY